MLSQRKTVIASVKLLTLATCASAACYCYPNINDKACDGLWIDIWRTCNGAKCHDEIIQNGSARHVEQDLGAGATEVGVQTTVPCVIQRYVCDGYCKKVPTLAPVEATDQNIQGETCGSGPCLPQQPGGND